MLVIVILLHMVPLALNCGGGGGGGGCFVGKSKCPNTASPYCMPNSEKWRCCKAGKHCKLVPCPWVCRDYQRRCVCCDEPFDCKFGNCKCPAKGWRFYVLKQFILMQMFLLLGRMRSSTNYANKWIQQNLASWLMQLMEILPRALKNDQNDA